MRRGGQKQGIFGIVAQGAGFAAEYHHHRKEQKVLRDGQAQEEQQSQEREQSRQREQSREQQHSQYAEPGPSSARRSTNRSGDSSCDPPPAYDDVVDRTAGMTIAPDEPEWPDNKARYNDDKEGFDDSSIHSSVESIDHESVESDEELWELDEAAARNESDVVSPSKEPPSKDGDKAQHNTDKLVQEVLLMHARANAQGPFVRSPLPCPVIIPQRRPNNKKRGFIRAYAPLLGECSGIDQDTFLLFLKNFHAGSQASPVFGVIQLAAGIAGLAAPGPIAMAVTASVQIAAQVGEEMHVRYRTNSFLDRMNEELFKPAGLYAMIVKYTSDAEIEQSGNSFLARFGVAPQRVNLTTNETIVKYNRADSNEAGSSMSDRMRNFRTASSNTRGAMEMPQSAPLIFPNLDKIIVKEGPETFKDKTKDFKKFLANYMDKRAQIKYAQDDPTSALAIPEEQRTFKSKYADPTNPIYSGGLAGLASGGARSTNRRNGGSGDFNRREGYGPDDYYSGRQGSRRQGGGQRRRQNRGDFDDMNVYPGRDGGRFGGRRGGGGMMLGGGGMMQGGLVGSLVGAAMNAAGNNGPEARESLTGRDGGPRDQRPTLDAPNMGFRRSAPDLSPASGYNQRTSRAQYDRYGRPGYDESYSSYGNSGYGSRQYQQSSGRGRQQRGGGGGAMGLMKKAMKQDVLYLTIVNMPSEAELREARSILDQARSR